MQTPVGNSALRRLIFSANIPAPSTKVLQCSRKLLNAWVQQINEKDIQERRKNLSEVNKYRNQANTNAIDIEGDGIFNNKLYSGVGKNAILA